jgi:hypothetical protein
VNLFGDNDSLKQSLRWDVHMFCFQKNNNSQQSLCRVVVMFYFPKRIEVSTESVLGCSHVLIVNKNKRSQQSLCWVVVMFYFPKRIEVSTESVLRCSHESVMGLFTCFIVKKKKSLNRVCAGLL